MENNIVIKKKVTNDIITKIMHSSQYLWFNLL
jgi:hypothetical protein